MYTTYTNSHGIFTGYIDEHGNPITKTKHTHPYSYDGFVQWRGGSNDEANGTVYSDRMSQWDYEKNDALKKKHFGNVSDYFSGRQPKDIEAYLSDYFGKPVKLILVMEYCNVSNGYPVWRFDYKTDK